MGGRGHVFLPGMTVWHPDYGTGLVVSVSGTGLKRKAQVQFVQGGDTKSFLIAHSPLEPVPD
jgi:DNA helicase-2/ATP-dependent DNA helicase PcrA